MIFFDYHLNLLNMNLDSNRMSIGNLEYQVLLEKAENGELEELAATYHQLGCLSNNKNRAISFYKKSIEINLSYPSVDYGLLSASYSNIGHLLKKRGDYNQALTYYRRALNIDQRCVTIDELKIADRCIDIGNVLKCQGNYKEAKEYFDRASKIQKTNKISSNDPILVKIYLNIGSLHQLTNEYPLSLNNYEKALEILEAHLPVQHSLLIYAYNKLGSLYFLMKNYIAAFSCQEKALKIQEKIISSNHPSLAIRHFNMAAASEGLKMNKRAVDHITIAIDILRQAQGKHQHQIRKYQKYLQQLRQK